MGAHDDLHGFDEESLLRALRAPGSSSELADEERYVAAFRDHGRGRIGTGGRASRRRGAAARRLGAGTALAVVVGVSGGGVAAAYTANLPEPLQDFAHRVLGPVAVPPAPTPKRPDQSPEVRTAPSATPSSTPASSPQPEPTPTPTPSPSRKPEPAKPSGPSKPSKSPQSPSSEPTEEPSTTSTPQVSPAPTPSATPTPTATPSPTSEVSPSPTATPSGTPTATTLPPPAAGVSIEGATHVVEYGLITSFSGVVTDEDGKPIAGADAALQRRGPNGWRRVTTAVADETGVVTFETAPVTLTATFRLRSGSVYSDPWHVVMRPLLTVTSEVKEVSDDSVASVVISVATAGGLAGDRAQLVTRRGGKSVIVGEGVLDADESIAFGISQSKRRAAYDVVLLRTEFHGPSRASIRVTLPDDDS